MNHVAAVIGAGFVGRAHIEALRRIPVRVKGTLVSSGERVAYALCRPPGHHVTRTAYGGSCYLNNAAIAAAHPAETLALFFSRQSSTVPPVTTPEQTFG